MTSQERLEFFTTLIEARRRDVEESIKLEVLDIQILYNHIRAGSIKGAYSLYDAILFRKFDAGIVDYIADSV